MEPRHFDEEFMDEHDLGGDVMEIFGAHHHINTLLGDINFKRSVNFVSGLSDYEAKVSLITTNFDSLMEDHPLEGDEVIALCFGQQHQRDVVLQDGEEDTTDEFADGLAYLTAEQARDLSDMLLEYADEVEEANAEDEEEESE